MASTDVVTFYDSRQVPGRADDERGMDMIITEEAPHLPDSGSERMLYGHREHRIGDGTHGLVHRSDSNESSPASNESSSAIVRA
jgi:hypothetical protein